MSTSNPLAAMLLTLLIVVPPAASAEVQPRVFVPRQPGAEPPWLQSQLREIDDHYAARTQEMQQQLHQALETMKQHPTAEQLNALRDVISRLESQVTQLAAATTRTADGLTGLKSQLDTLQSAATPKPAVAETADAEFEQALTALRSAEGDIDPMRRWLDQHRNHPKAPEGYLQLGMQTLNRSAALGQQYLNRVIDDFPTSPQATQAKVLLAGSAPGKAIAAKPAPKKVVKRKSVPPAPAVPRDSDEPAPAPVLIAPTAGAAVQSPPKPTATEPKESAEDMPAIHVKPPLSIPKDKRAGS